MKASLEKQSRFLKVGNQILNHFLDLTKMIEIWERWREGESEECLPSADINDFHIFDNAGSAKRIAESGVFNKINFTSEEIIKAGWKTQEG